MQQSIEAMLRLGIGQSGGRASMTGETTGALDIAGVGQLSKARDEKLDQLRVVGRCLVRSRVWQRLDQAIHRRLVSPIPRNSLASVLIICGVQGGS